MALCRLPISKWLRRPPFLRGTTNPASTSHHHPRLAALALCADTSGFSAVGLAVDQLYHSATGPKALNLSYSTGGLSGARVAVANQPSPWPAPGNYSVVGPHDFGVLPAGAANALEFCLFIGFQGATGPTGTMHFWSTSLYGTSVSGQCAAASPLPSALPATATPSPGALPSSSPSPAPQCRTVLASWAWNTSNYPSCPSNPLAALIHVGSLAPECRTASTGAGNATLESASILGEHPAECSSGGQKIKVRW
jgi:hypothetical protein